MRVFDGTANIKCRKLINTVHCFLGLYHFFLSTQSMTVTNMLQKKLAFQLFFLIDYRINNSE